MRRSAVRSKPHLQATLWASAHGKLPISALLFSIRCYHNGRQVSIQSWFSKSPRLRRCAQIQHLFTRRHNTQCRFSSPWKRTYDTEVSNCFLRHLLTQSLSNNCRGSRLYALKRHGHIQSVRRRTERSSIASCRKHLSSSHHIHTNSRHPSMSSSSSDMSSTRLDSNLKAILLFFHSFILRRPHYISLSFCQFMYVYLSRDNAPRGKGI